MRKVEVTNELLLPNLRAHSQHAPRAQAPELHGDHGLAAHTPAPQRQARHATRRPVVRSLQGNVKLLSCRCIPPPKAQLQDARGTYRWRGSAGEGNGGVVVLGGVAFGWGRDCFPLWAFSAGYPSSNPTLLVPCRFPHQDPFLAPHAYSARTGRHGDLDTGPLGWSGFYIQTNGKTRG